MPEVIEPIDEPVTAQEELADFKSGFSDEPPTETPEVIKEPEPEAPPEPKTKVLLEDEYQILLESAAQVSAMKATNEKQFGTAFGKLGGIERFIQQLQNAPAGQAPEVTADDFADLLDYGDEMPEAQAKAFNKALSKVKLSAPAVDEAALEPIVQRRVSEALELAKQERQNEAEETVADAHEDFKEIFAEPGFTEWRKTLPENRRLKLEHSWNPTVISKAITDYKAAKAKQAAPVPPAPPKDNSRKELLEASIAPRGTSAATAGKKTEMEEFLSGLRS